MHLPHMAAIVGALISEGIEIHITQGPVGPNHTKGTGYLDKDLGELMGIHKAVLIRKGFHGHDALLLDLPGGKTSIFSRYGDSVLATGGTDILPPRITNENLRETIFNIVAIFSVEVAT